MQLHFSQWPTEFELSFCTVDDGQFPAISFDESCAVLIKHHNCSRIRFVNVNKPKKGMQLSQSDFDLEVILNNYPKNVILMSKNFRRYSLEMNGIEYEIKCKTSAGHAIAVENIRHLDQNYDIGDRDIVALISSQCNDPILEGVIIDTMTPGRSQWALIHSNKLVKLLLCLIYNIL